MKLIFEKSVEDRQLSLLPELDVPEYSLDEGLTRETPPQLPEMAEIDISRHYTQLAKRVHGVNDGFYPLGSCTMKYNPRFHDEIAGMKAFAGVHPLQPVETAQGSLEALHIAEEYFCEITGMDAMTFQPAAGAQGELLGVLLIKAYHKSRGDSKRNKIIVPDAAHGTNPATASMAGYDVINVPSDDRGMVDVNALKRVVGEDTAGLMLTNPNTIGLFDKNIVEITKIIHDAGGLNYYDGANLNPIMGIVRPGDMGFDVVHLNLHKTFSTPHGGGGPGSGPVGCKDILKPFLPKDMPYKDGDSYGFYQPEQTIGRVRSFYGNFLVTLKALLYVMTLGAEGIKDAAQNAVLNANYMKEKLKDTYDIPFGGIVMHEFVISAAKLKKDYDVTAMDIAKMLIDKGIHPPTMYFPLIVEEALMFEPTETESKETLDEAISVLKEIYDLAKQDPEKLKAAPTTTPVSRVDEVMAARNPILKYNFGEN